MHSSECFLLLDVMSVCNPSYSFACCFLLLFVVALSSTGIAIPCPSSTKRRNQDIAFEGSTSSRSGSAIFWEYDRILPDERRRSVHVGNGRGGRALGVKRGAIASTMNIGSSRDRPTRSNSDHKTTAITTNVRNGAHAATTSTHTTGTYFLGVSMLVKRVVKALKSGVLALGDIGARSTSTTTAEGFLRRPSTTPPVFAVFVALVCILTVAAANAAHIAVPRPLAGRRALGTSRREGAPAAAVVGDAVLSTVAHNAEGGAAVVSTASDSEGQRGGKGPLSSSFRGRMKLWQEQRQKGREERIAKVGSKRKDRLLLRTPSFPLAHTSWWQPWQDRPRRIASTVAEGLEVEDHEVTERAEGTQMFRSAQFWGQSAIIYLSYKKMQARCALELPRIKNEEERELKRKSYWEETHELNSNRMLKLCLDLRGFYLKSGQFLGTRYDFMPKIFLQKLGKLHDDVPPMPASRVSEVIKKELDAPPSEVFSSLNLTHPVGSASISQVHRGVLRETGEKVAVKVQYPGAERVMMSDLRNLRALAWFLQKFELNFDILSSLRELSKQIKGEFDFRAEAKTMDRMYVSLGEDFSRISLPQSRVSSKRLLIMSYVEGESLAQLKRGGKERFKAARKRIGKHLLHELASAWGHMIFTEGLFNADPHPGNILIIPDEKVGPIKRVFALLGLRTPKLRIGLLDWGQTKELRRIDREKVANLILAVSNRQSNEIVSCFNKLGAKLSNPDDADSIEKLALVMFDTRTIKGLDFNPFSSNNVLKLNAVKEYPQEFYFVLRTVLMFRGMAQSLGVEFSLADFWAPYARRLIESSPSPLPPPPPRRRASAQPER